LVREQSPVSELPPTDPTAARDLAGVLAPDETVLWAGRPDERHFTRVDVRLIGLGVFWTAVSGAAFVGFALTFLSEEYAGIALGARIAVLALAAAPFAAVAVYCLGGHVAIRRRTRARTAYAITDRRVVASRPSLGGVAGPPLLREMPHDRAAEPRVEAVHRESGHVDVHDAKGVEAPVQFRCVRGAEAVARLVAGQRIDGT
jgi:hypothetical protein